MRARAGGTELGLRKARPTAAPTRPTTAHTAHDHWNPARATWALDMLAPDLPAPARFLTERLELLPGVRAVDALLATSLYAEGTGDCVPWPPRNRPCSAANGRSRMSRPRWASATDWTANCSTCS